MSFLKQLLSPFIEFEEENSAKARPAVAPASAPKPTPAPDPPSGPNPVPPTTQAPRITMPTVPDPQHARHPMTDDQEYGVRIKETLSYSPSGTLTGPLKQHEKYFEDLIDKANKTNPFFAGNDYKEFIDAKLDIDDILDESIKYRTAFSILKGAGLTKDKLIKTAQEYLNIIGRDLNTFQSAHTERYKRKLGDKESELAKKAEQLQMLLRQVHQLKNEMNTLTQDIKLGADVLNTMRDSFVLAGETKQDEIQREMDKIVKYF